MKKQILAQYLEHNLQCKVVDKGVETIATLSGIYSDGTCVFADLVEGEQGFESVMLILRPLSDLTKEIEHNGEKFVPHTKLGGRPNLTDYDIDYLSKKINVMSYGLITQLIEWHFDVFGLIEKGEAIDINTI